MKVVWTVEAKGDLAERLADAAGFGAHAVRRLKRTIRRKQHLLARFPHAGPQLDGDDGRYVLIDGTPLVLVYRIVGEAVVIEAVFHGAQDR